MLSHAHAPHARYWNYPNISRTPLQLTSAPHFLKGLYSQRRSTNAHTEPAASPGSAREPRVPSPDADGLPRLITAFDVFPPRSTAHMRGLFSPARGNTHRHSAGADHPILTALHIHFFSKYCSHQITHGFLFLQCAFSLTISCRRVYRIFSYAACDRKTLRREGVHG